MLDLRKFFWNDFLQTTMIQRKQLFSYHVLQKLGTIDDSFEVNVWSILDPSMKFSDFLVYVSYTIMKRFNPFWARNVSTSNYFLEKYPKKMILIFFGKILLLTCHRRGEKEVVGKYFPLLWRPSSYLLFVKHLFNFPAFLFSRYLDIWKITKSLKNIAKYNRVLRLNSIVVLYLIQL